MSHRKRDHDQPEVLTRPPLPQTYTRNIRPASNAMENRHDQAAPSKQVSPKKNPTASQKWSFVALAIAFAFAALSLFLLFRSFPELSENDRQHLRLPWTMDDAKQLGRVLSQYKDSHFVHVVVGYCCVFIFLQTFAIPGSMFLCVLAGFLFSFPLGLFLVCLCSATGASGCYLLSALIFQRTRLVEKYLPQRVESWRQQIAQHRNDLLSYLVFLRVTPFLPNWFINITSPVIGLPLSTFYIGTFIGVAPPMAIAVTSGSQLYELTSKDDVITWKALSIVSLFALLALLPVIFKKLFAKRFQ